MELSNNLTYYNFISFLPNKYIIYKIHQHCGMLFIVTNVVDVLHCIVFKPNPESGIYEITNYCSTITYSFKFNIDPIEEIFRT